MAYVTVLGLCAITMCRAADPVVQTKFTADPAPMVYNGTVYLYTSHDEDYAPAGMAGFRMRDWLCYTSTDMVNWTDHGSVASLKNFSWAKSSWGGFENGAWAPQTIERNGKFYMYCPVQGSGIGVLVADNPLGPFTDPLGKPLIGPQFDSIDPTVFIDDDGQAYLYWGNPNMWYVKLKEDMISFTGEPVKEPSIAKIEGKQDLYHYQEGPWIYKRDGHYYNAYASTCCPEGIAYSMSDSPTGPWEFKGYIVRPDRRSSGNHPGIIDYKGGSYVFGFNYKLNFAITSEHHERRSVCVEKFEYNQDGTIPELPWWEEAEAVQQLGYLNPRKKTEAETICWSKGVKTQACSEGGMNVCNIDDGDYIKVKGVDFGAGAERFTARVASATEGGRIEVRLDGPDGKLAGTCTVPGTGGRQTWITVSCPVNEVGGVRDLYLRFAGDSEKLFNFNWWKFD
ncbi:MAG: glycoside hydrolase family 43 protein [Phycisphaerae bacterium]